jgi:TonB family protein
MRYLWIAAALGLSLVRGLVVHPANASRQAGETQLGAEAELDALPELVRFVEADYPPEALRRGIEGTVLLDLIINETGRVDSVSVAEGIDPSLDIAAVRAARDFVFTPALTGGEPVAVLLQYEYAFSIREETRRITEYVNFSGTLREKETRAAIPDAVVAVSFPDPGADTTLTVPWDAYLERLGEFGPLLVAFPNAGYPFTQQVEELGRGAHLQIDYWLERTSYDEYELVVYGKAEDKEVTRQRLELTEVQKIPGLGGDALRVVQTMPGVARPTFMWGDVIVRGSSADDTRFYLDGVDIPLLFHFGGLKSTYNSLALSSGPPGPARRLAWHPRSQSARCERRARRADRQTHDAHPDRAPQLHQQRVRAGRRRLQRRRPIHRAVLLGSRRAGRHRPARQPQSVPHRVLRRR